jgi:hypothetical protein
MVNAVGVVVVEDEPTHTLPKARVELDGVSVDDGYVVHPKSSIKILYPFFDVHLTIK